MSAAVFLLALPLSVYLLAGAFMVIDAANRSAALLSFTLRLAICALLVAVLPADSRIWVGAAFLTVLLLHAATSVGARYALRSGRWPTEKVD